MAVGDDHGIGIDLPGLDTAVDDSEVNPAVLNMCGLKYFFQLVLIFVIVYKFQFFVMVFFLADIF